MMKFKLLLIVLTITFLLWVLTTAVMAQEEPPPPYTSLKNPFPWSDASVQEAGEGLYQQYCLSCHGAKGNNLAGSDFSAADYPQRMEERPDFYFWILSEGKLDKGMPPYKFSLSEQQRWQVLTYLWSLGTAAAPPETNSLPTQPPVEGVDGILLLTTPGHAQSGQPLTLTATLQDRQGKSIRDATVKFFIRVDFFTSGLMEIGDALTNDQGVAILEYTPRLMGDIQIVARYEAIEATTAVSLTETNEAFYQTEAGIQLPAPGQEVLIGPESSLELGEMGKAPTSAFRLPGGILSWLLLLVIAVMLIWLTYFGVMYQVFRIPIVKEIRDTDTRLVPLAGLAIVVVMGILLVLMLITGPYSHFHLLP
jgi:mono/diheme cytochrome c family protein